MGRRTLGFATLAALLLLLAPGAGHTAPEAEEWVEAAGDDFDEVEGALLVVRVRDAWTGRPVAGALVSAYEEACHPISGSFRPVASATTDPDGRARLPREGLAPDAEWDWIHVEAAGYAPTALFEGGVSQVVDLPLGLDVPVELRDPLDRPVPGARIEYLLGCGHAPDVRRAVTDAEGRAIVPDTNAKGYGQMWIRSDRVESGYVSYYGWRPGDPPVLRRCPWARPIVGRVLDAEGRPAVGVAVGMSETHRGPWTRTDERGDFRLLGLAVEPGDSIFVEAFEERVSHEGRGPTRLFEVPPAGMSRTVRLPQSPNEDGEEDEATGPERSTALYVEVRSYGSSGEAVEVFVLRPADGWMVHETLSAGSMESGTGILRLQVPPGDLVVSAHRADLPHPGSSWARLKVRAVEGGLAEARLELHDARRLPVSWHGAPEHARLFLVTEDMEVPVERPEDGRASIVVLPASGDAYLRSEAEDAVRVVRVLEAWTDPDAVAVEPPWPRLVRVHARLFDADGRPVAGRLVVGHDAKALDEPSQPPRQDPEVTTFLGEGLRAYVVSDPEGRDRTSVALPAEPPSDEPIDLGEIRLPRIPEVRLFVRTEEDLPLQGATVRVVGPTSRWAGTSDAAGSLRPAAGETAIAEGAEVFVEAAEEGTVLWSSVLEGPGPWTLRAPAGRIEVHAKDEAGAPLEAYTVRLDGEVRPVRKLPWAVRHVAAGSHEVVVLTPGRRAQRLRFDLAAGEKRVLEPRLRPVD